MRFAAKPESKSYESPTPHFQRIQERIERIAHDPRFPGTVRLQGETGYRTRVGDYRILYEIDDENQTIMIYRVKHRRDVYRD